MKRKLIEQFESSEKHVYESMQQVSMTMSRTMLQGFGMISQMLQQHSGPSHFQGTKYGSNWGENHQAFQQQMTCPISPLLQITQTYKLQYFACIISMLMVQH